MPRPGPARPSVIERRRIYSRRLLHRPVESAPPRPRALTAQAFASRLTWNDMEPIGIFAGRIPAGVSGGPVGQTGDTRRFQYYFPGGGAIILLARPCERGGLCVWAVDVE